MNRSIHIFINVLFILTVVIVAVIISTMALSKKIERDREQYSNNLKGTIIKQEVPILASSRGIVKKIHVRVGQEVKKNDLLVELDNPVLAGKIKALEQYPDNLSAKTEARVAQEEMKGLRLYAPANGVVTELVVAEGSPVDALGEIMTMYSNEDILVLADLSEDQYSIIQQLGETNAYSTRLNQNFTIQPDILQPEQKLDKYNEKKIGLYFKFKDKEEAQSLLHNEDVELNINGPSSEVIKPIDYIVGFWRSFTGKTSAHE